MAKPIIRLENVSKYYTGTGGIGLGLRRVNAEFHLGEFVIITGPSGSGKTTLLNVISGMDSYEEGILYVEEEDTSYFGAKDYEEYRRNYIGFIFQNYNLIDSFTVFENIELALIARGVPKLERNQQVTAIIEEVGLTKRKKHRVTELSGGEKQRVAIARALASDAPILVCDEITGNLDRKTGNEIIALLKRVSRGKLVLLVTHDPSEAIQYATKIITMHDGTIENNTSITPIETNYHLQTNESMPINNKTILALSFKSLIRTPRKTLLMFLIVLTSTFLCAYAYSIYANFNQSYQTDMGWSSRNGISYYDGRIVIKKMDQSEFTENDYQQLNTITGVKNIIKGDLGLDQMARFYLKTVEYSNSYPNIRSIGDLKRQDLAYGDLPQEANQLVLETRDNAYQMPLKDLIGQEIRIAFDLIDEVRDMVIVGVVETLNQEYIYVHGDILKEINVQATAFHSNFTFKVDAKKLPNNGYLYPFNMESNGFTVKEKTSLQDDELEIATFTKGDLLFEPILTEVIYENIYQQLSIPNLKASLIEFEINKVNNTFDWRDTVEVNYNRQSIIYLSKTNFEKLSLNKVFQVSITANKDDVNKVAKLIEQGQFYALPITKPDSLSYTNPFSIFLQIIIVLIVMVLISGIYFLTYFSLRNIVHSHQKGYLVMRSLGIDGSKISLQIYFNHLIISLLSFITMLIFWLFIRQRTRMNFFEPIIKMTFSQLILIGFITALIAVLLANRFSKKIIAETIVAKVME